MLMILFLITRMPDNPITGRAGPIMPIAITIEVFQAAFIGLTAAIIVYEIKRKGLAVKLRLRPHSGGLDSLSQPSHIINLNIHPELLCIFHEFFEAASHVQ